MADLKFAVFGTGWWSHFQIPAWFEVGGVELVALYNRTVSKAEKMAERFDVPRVYGDPEELLQKEELDFIDIITEVQAHAPLVYLAAKYKVPVICQKPMGPDYGTCQKMVQTCQEAGVPFLIHENLRWHTPIRAVKRIIGEGQIGAARYILDATNNDAMVESFRRELLDCAEAVSGGNGLSARTGRGS